MKISIITISYNSRDTIEDTIRSVISQDYPDIEYIIVDGASTDGTQQVIEKYRSKIHAYISEPDKGIYDAMNKGLKMTTGEVVGILNSDDVYAGTSVITKVVEGFIHSKVDALYGDLVYVMRNNLDAITRTWSSGKYKEGDFIKGWMPPHPAFFVKKWVYEKFGYFRTDLKIAADYEIMLRFIHKERIKISYLPLVITKMRVGGESNLSLKNRLIANKEDRLAWKLNGLNPGLFTLLLKPIRKVGQFFKK